MKSKIEKPLSIRIYISLDKDNSSLNDGLMQSRIAISEYLESLDYRSTHELQFVEFDNKTKPTPIDQVKEFVLAVQNVIKKHPGRYVNAASKVTQTNWKKSYALLSGDPFLLNEEERDKYTDCDTRNSLSSVPFKNITNNEAQELAQSRGGKMEDNPEVVENRDDQIQSKQGDNEAVIINENLSDSENQPNTERAIKHEKKYGNSEILSTGPVTNSQSLIEGNLIALIFER